MESSKDKIFEAFKKRIKEADSDGQKITEQQVSVLLGELHLAQIEVEMQNDELINSAKLLESERSRFAGFFNSAPVGYFILDHIGQIDEVNQMGLSLLTISKEKIINQRFQSFVSPDDWENFYVFLHRMQPHAVKQSTELKFELINGQEIYARVEGIAIINTYSNKLQYYVTVIDMTSDRAAQQQLRETTQRLEMTLNASETGTWTADLANKRVFFDGYSISLLELNAKEFDGSIHTFINSIHPDDRIIVKQALLVNSDRLQKINFEFKTLTNDGKTKHLSARGQVIQNLNGAPYLAGVITDITKIRQIDQADHELREEKQKLILSTTFNAQEKERHKISSILHDSICQLLYGIRLNLQHISKDPEFGIVYDLLAQAIKETRELSYELTPSVLRDFGFVAALREITERLNSSHFKITLQISEEADLLPNSLQLSMFRMVQELLNNCIKHAEMSKADISVMIKNGYTTIKVADNGKGFNPDFDNEIKGSGLRGIKNRVFLLNGDFNLNTTKKGTIITIKFKNEF